jgi:hypothetical protein
VETTTVRIALTGPASSYLWWLAVHRGQPDDLVETLGWATGIAEMIEPVDCSGAESPQATLLAYLARHGAAADPVVFSIAERVAHLQAARGIRVAPGLAARLSTLAERRQMSVEAVTEWVALVGLIVLCDPSTYYAQTPLDAMSAFLLRAYARNH